MLGWLFKQIKLPKKGQITKWIQEIVKAFWLSFDERVGHKKTAHQLTDFQ